MSSITLDLKVTADAKAAVAGLKPLSRGLEQVTKSADKTEKALNDLDHKHKINLDDQAIDTATKEIQRLRRQMAEDLRVDVNADTRLAQRRISQLESSIRTLKRGQNKVDVKVDVDDGGLSRLRAGFSRVGRAGKSAVGGIGAGLGKLAQSSGVVVGSVIGAVAAVAIAAGAVTKVTVGLADDLDNASIAFGQFLGGTEKAGKFLRNLQKFAAKTPFEFPELIASSKTLLAFGIRGDDVIDIMTTLGDAAALTGASVEDLTVIWGQMAAKGKVSNEELMQLTEAGIPAYQLLATAMGKTVAQVQKMAEKGQLLSGKTLPILQAKLDKTFGGGMAKQAGTLSGKLSTIKDTLSGFGTSIGQAILPFVSALADKVQPKLEELAAWAKENRGEFATIFTDAGVKALEFVAMALDGLADLSDAFIRFAADSLIAVGQLGQGLSDLPGVDDKLGDSTVEAGNKLKDAVRNGTAFSNTIRGIADDTRTAAGDFRDFGADVAAGLRLDSAKSELDEINTKLTALGKKKPTPKVKAEIKEWEAKRKQVAAGIAALQAARAVPKVDANTSAAKEKLRNLDKAMNNAARGRTATVSVSTAGASETERELNHLSRDRHATVHVNYVGNTPGEHSGIRAGETSLVPQRFGDSATVAGLRSTSTQAVAMGPGVVAMRPSSDSHTGTVTQLAPRQVPLKVYLDGAEIADHLQLKAGRLATASSVRRRA